MSMSNDMEIAVSNIQAFEDASNRLCSYQDKMNKMYLNIIDAIRIIMSHGTEKECSTLVEYIEAFKEKFPGADSYAMQLLSNAAPTYDEFYATFNSADAGTKLRHANLKGLVNAARIYKEIEKDMFYDRGVKFEYATDETFISVSRLDVY